MPTYDDQHYDQIGDMLMTKSMMPMLTVYQSPADYPGKVVLRRSDASAGTVKTYQSQAVFDTLLEARHWIRRTYPHLIALWRAIDDEPQIVEVWL